MAMLIIAPVANRRVHLAQMLSPGVFPLDSSEAHHVRDVLRLKVRDTVEAFDDFGHLADGSIESCDANHVRVRIEQVRDAIHHAEIVIASAIPKGERADWMIEKLSELGVNRFIPLMTARSVVHPKGAGKRERWMRIAVESAKQSRRAGVMQIDELISLASALNANPQTTEGRYFLSTDTMATSIFEIRHLTFGIRRFFIGPEGGWSVEEIELLKASGLTALKLTGTILRVETAAVAAAAIVACLDPSAT